MLLEGHNVSPSEICNGISPLDPDSLLTFMRAEHYFASRSEVALKVICFGKVNHRDNQGLDIEQGVDIVTDVPLGAYSIIEAIVVRLATIILRRARAFVDLK